MNCFRNLSFIFVVSILVPNLALAESSISQTMSQINSINCQRYAYAAHKRWVAGVGVMSSEKSIRETLLKGVNDPTFAEHCASDVADNFCDGEFLSLSTAIMTTGGPVSSSGQAFYGILTAAGLASGGGNTTSSTDLLAGGGGLLLGGKVGSWATDGSVLGTLGGAGAGALAGITLNNSRESLKACNETQAQFDRLTKMLVQLKLRGQSNEVAFYQDIQDKAARLDANPDIVRRFAAKPSEIAALMIETMKKTADRF